MSFLNRIQEILTANINDILDKVENPEVSINQIIRDMEKGISDMRKHTAAIMASRKINGKRLQNAEEEENKWLKNAELAISENRDDLAKKALLKKNLAKEQKEMIGRQLETEISLIEKMKSELIMLEDKIQEARAKRNTLVAKKQAEKTRRQFTENNQKWSGAAEKIINGFNQFNQPEDEKDIHNINRETHDQQQEEDVQRTFQKLKNQKNLEDELSELKKKIKKEL